MKRVIVTGASGLIGKALTKKLLENGVEVWAISRTGTALRRLASDKLHIITTSFQNYECLPELIHHRGFDVLFHFAWGGYATASGDYKVQMDNVMASCAIAGAASELGVNRFIFADSSHEFLQIENGQERAGPSNIYGSAKLCARVMCQAITRSQGIEFLGALFINVFGVGDMTMRSVNQILLKLSRDEPLNLIDAERKYSWTYVDDCVHGVLCAAERGKSGKIYYVGQPLQPFSEIIEQARDAVGSSSTLNFGAYHDSAEIDYSKIDFSALTTDTGFQCSCNFQDSVLKTVQYLKSELNYNMEEM